MWASCPLSHFTSSSRCLRHVYRDVCCLLDIISTYRDSNISKSGWNKTCTVHLDTILSAKYTFLTSNPPRFAARTTRVSIKATRLYPMKYSKQHPSHNTYITWLSCPSFAILADDLKDALSSPRFVLPSSYAKSTQIQVSQGHYLLPAHAHPHYLNTSPTQQNKGMIVRIRTWWSESTQRGKYSWYVTWHILNTIASVTLQNKSCWEELCLVQSLHPNIHVSPTHRIYISCTQPY